MTTQQYQQASEYFLAQARRELADGDLAQASEKGWGAAVQILKPSSNSGAGSTTATAITTERPAESVPKPATARYVGFSTLPAPRMKTSMRTTWRWTRWPKDSTT